MRELIGENDANVSRLTSKEAELMELVKLNERFERDAKESAAKLMQNCEVMTRERQMHEEQMANLEAKINEAEKLLATTKTEFERALTASDEHHKTELDKMRQLVEASVDECDDLQSKLLQKENDLMEMVEKLEMKSSKMLAANAANELLQSKVDDVNAKIAQTEDTLKTTSERLEKIRKEKNDFADKLKGTEQLIVALNGEIVDAQREAKKQEQANGQQQVEIDQSVQRIRLLTEEKIQLEKDNLSLALARANAEAKIIELSEKVTVQSKELDEQRIESIQKHDDCVRERDDLKAELIAVDGKLSAATETSNAKCKELSQLKQDIVLKTKKHVAEVEKLQLKRDEALAEIQSHRMRIDELQSELIASEKMHVASSDRMEILMREKSELEEKMNHFESTINKFTDDLSIATRATENDQAKLNEYETENKRLETAIVHLTAEKEKIDDELRQVVQCRSDAEEKITALDTTVAELRAEKEHLRQTIEAKAQSSVETEQRFVRELKTADGRILDLKTVSFSHSFSRCLLFNKNRNFLHFTEYRKLSR